MKLTLEYILFCQSPALFLLAVIFLLCHFTRRKKQKALGAVDLICAIVCLLLGLALYYFGMLKDVFTIHDFWQIHTPGWVGLVVAAVIAVVVFVRRGGRFVRKKQEAKAAVKAQNAAAQELEKAKAEAFEAGKSAVGSAAAAASADAPVGAGTAAAQPTEGQPAGGQADGGQQN